LSKYIVRDLIHIPPSKKTTKDGKEENTLERVLIIGPVQVHKCHFSENIFDCFRDAGFDVKYLCPSDLNLTEKQQRRKEEYYLSNIQKILGDWKPQMIWIDFCWVFFRNTLSIPVFYFHMPFMRDPMVRHPTVLYLYHEDILKYYERFHTDYMVEIPHKEVMYVAYNPETWKPAKKTYKGINAFGGREGFKGVYAIDEILVIAEARLLEQEHEEYKKFGLNYFEGTFDDDTYRKMMPKCEALWVNLSARQFTSRTMLECMGTKTMCFMKTMEEEGNHRIEEILLEMGLKKGEHYYGVDKISELPQAFNKAINKRQVLADAYKLVSENHTYKNRMEQIIEKYNEIMEAKK